MITSKEKLTTQKLQNIPETMLITLRAKATESRTKQPILQDKKAEEILEKIDYDFSKFKKAKASQIGCCIRAKLIDQEIQAFIKENPDAVIIQIGAGLDARYERLGRPKITHRYDLDLPEAIELRKQVLAESENNSFLSLSLFDYKWIDIVSQHNKPILIVSEGVLMYFEEDQIKNLFNEISKKIDKTTVIFDMLAYFALKYQKHHDALKKINSKADFKWSLLDTKTMETRNPKIHIKKEFFISDYYKNKRPMIWRLLCKFKTFYKKGNQRIVSLEIK